MSNLTEVLLLAMPAREEGRIVLDEILGSELDTALRHELMREDLYVSLRDYGHGVRIVSINYARLHPILRELESIEWAFPEHVLLLIRPEAATQWGVLRLDPVSLSWVSVIEPTVWDGESWAPLPRPLLDPKPDHEP